MFRFFCNLESGSSSGANKKSSCNLFLWVNSPPMAPRYYDRSHPGRNRSVKEDYAISKKNLIWPSGEEDVVKASGF